MSTTLNRLTERIWIFPYEEERDRPNLGYIRGDRWSIAVDAGHSQAHTEEFYQALEEEGLPLPDLTVLTHWHWDHTFGMHAVHGLCLASARTNGHLLDFAERIRREGTKSFFDHDVSIRREYAGGRPVIITPADIVYSGCITLDAGSCPVKVFETKAPHTDDSTLIEVPGERVLFIGDAACGALPDWKKDPALSESLTDTIRKAEADICVEGHWVPVPKEETVRDLSEGV